MSEEQQHPKIVVITPVKNESWVLNRFLSATSHFADNIIVADQLSSDASREICSLYPKVTLISNKNEKFNEAERQILLLNAARELVPEKKLIFALDADEILSANYSESRSWQTMLEAEPGTIIYFEKVSICGDASSCVRYYPFPLAYMDDGAEHEPTFIHSTRIPMPADAKKIIIHDIKVIHYLFMRPGALRSKERYYCVLESLSNRSNILGRRTRYQSSRNYLAEGPLEKVRDEWFDKWQDKGIDMFSICDSQCYWYDYELLKIFQEYGTIRFWLEDIWNFDWDTFHQRAISEKYIMPADLSIVCPPYLLSIILKLLTHVYILMRQIIKMG